MYADRRCSAAPEYEEGQAVTVQNTKSRQWELGEIEKKLEQPRSYIIQLTNGQIIRRNARDIKESKRIAVQNEEPAVIFNVPEFEPAEEENQQQPTLHEEPTARRHNSPEPMRTRCGREVRGRRDGDFEYY